MLKKKKKTIYIHSARHTTLPQKAKTRNCIGAREEIREWDAHNDGIYRQASKGRTGIIKARNISSGVPIRLYKRLTRLNWNGESREESAVLYMKGMVKAKHQW